MRVALVSEHASPLAARGGAGAGGQNVHVAELAAALVRRGHQVAVYTRRDSAELSERVVTEEGYEVVHLDAGPATRLPKDALLPFMGEFGVQLERDWRQWQPDLAHAHFWMSGLASLDASRAIRTRGFTVPVAQTFHSLGVVRRRHEGDADTSPAERIWLERALARRADLVIATCPDEVAELIGLGIDINRIAVAPSGVDLDEFVPGGEVEPATGRPRITVVGRLVPRTGIDVAITAISQLRAAGQEVELHIVGRVGGEGATEVERLRRLASTQEVGDLVVFRGQVPRAELPAILRSSVAVACVPWYEPFGIVALEAMACGVPVIAAAVGGLQDSVVDGVTGLHVPPGDPQQLAHAISVLVDNPAIGSALGAAGRARVERGYSWDYVAELTEAAYQSILPATRPGSGRLSALGASS